MATKTHYKKLLNPDYLGAYALEDGRDIILTIRAVKQDTVTGTDGKKEVCSVCHFMENVKPMILNATNSKTIAKLFGSPYVEDWIGKPIQIGTERVKAFGDIWDALRVRPFHPQVGVIPTICADCGASIEAAGKLTPSETAAYTHKKYGRPLCARCATAEAEKRREAELTDSVANETAEALDAAMEGQDDDTATEN